jgi:hypothetical protein
MSDGNAMVPRVVGIIILATITTADAKAADTEDLARIERAITYLDARQDEWFKFSGAQRGQGADKTTCVSCHTGISYALARPALRQFAAKRGPAPAEERTIAAVNLRVEHWAELDTPRFRLMYDSNARKKAEARGTEAVINALILARDDANRGEKSPSAATQAALQHLWATQTTEGNAAGSWDWLNFGFEPWEASGSPVFGASLAAIALGSAPGYHGQGLDKDEAASRGVRLLRDYLRRRFSDENLYNRLWILEASTTFDGLLSADQKREVVDQVVALQREDGGWALAMLGKFKRVDGTQQAEDSEGYATALSLHAILRAGSPSKQAKVARGLAWLRAHQRKDGSWPGRSVNKERDPSTFVGKLMSDAATAMASTVLIEAEARTR